MTENESSFALLDRPQFIDRSKEKNILIEGLRSARKSRGGMILIDGEAGIGKTRLIEEIIQEAKDQEFRLLSGRCLDYRRSPYLPFIEILRGYFGISTDEMGNESKKRLLRSIEMEFTSLDRHKKEFMDFFLPQDEIVGGFRISTEMEKDTIREFQDRGYRTIVIGKVDELKEDLEVRDGVSFYPIKDSDNGGMNPKRIERIAARIKESFDRYKHCVIIFNALDMIISNNPEIKVKNLISIAVDLSRTKSGVVIFSTTDPTPSFIDELPEMDVNYQEADLVQSNDGDRENESSNKKNLIYELIPLFFKEISDRDPVLVVIEDLHWGDKPTYNLIQFLARDAKKEKLLIIGSYRSEEISLEEPKEGVSPFRDAIQRMSREHLFTTLSLKRFDRKNTKKMVSSMIGREIDIKEVKNLMDSTQGNPFFIIDYVRKMKDIDHPILETKPSEKLIGEELVSKRMASLEEREIEILNTSAVLSESITIENLHLILGIEIEELLDVMDTLMDLKFLVESEEKFIFEHPKVMESVYDQMGNDERSEIHKKIAETFKSEDGSDQSTGEIDLAVHHFYAGNYKEALDKLITRGKRQIEDRELDPAIKSINMALECLEENGVNKDTNAKWIEVLQIKGYILEEKDEMEQGLVVLRKALDIAEKNEMMENLSKLQRRIGDLLLKKFDWDGTTEHYLSSLHISKKNDDEFEISQAFKGLGRVYLLKADYHRSIECYIKYLEYPETRSGSESIRGMIDIGEIYYQMGDFNQALAYYKIAIKKSEESGSKDDISIGYIKMANVLLKLGEVEESKRYADLAREMVHSTEGYSANVETLLQYADLMLEVGQLEKADEVIKELEGSIDSSDRMLRAFACRVKGILYSRKRDFRGSITQFKASISMMEELQVPYHLALTYFHFGLIRFQQMDVDGALEMLEKASSLFKNIKSLFYLNRTSSKLREVSFIRDELKT